MLLLAVEGSILGDFLCAAAIPIIALVIWGILRRLDVRLCLLLGGFALAGIAGDIRPVLREFLSTLSNEKFVVPICTAMGFAYVLRHSQADRHLVQLLVKPLRHTPILLIPGVVGIGFLVNIPIISQSSTAICLGAVVVPLLHAAGLSPMTIGASMLLGTSIGGELLNPAAPELLTVKDQLHLGGTQEVVEKVLPLVIPHSIIATLIFWWMTRRREKTNRNRPLPPLAVERGELPEASIEKPSEPPSDFRVDVFLAAVPLIPLLILFSVGEPLQLLHVPESWLVDDKSKSAYGTRLIGAAMLVGVLAASLLCPLKARSMPKAFFDGAGYAFANVVSLIVTANCFGKAVEQIGFAQVISRIVQTAPGLLTPLAGSIPLLFACIGGSGMAATQSLYGLFVGSGSPLPIEVGTAQPDAVEEGKRLGAVVALAAAAGRTMSPVSAVTLMCSSMTKVCPFTLAKAVAIPLLGSWAIVLAMRMIGVW